MKRTRRSKLLAVMRRRPEDQVYPAEALHRLVEQLRDVRALGGATWAIDTGDGRNVQLKVKQDELSFFGVLDPARFYDEEHGRWSSDDQDTDPIYETIESIAMSLQRTTRWPLELVRLGDWISPESTCPACHAACFEWETSCPSCRADLSSDASEKVACDRDDELARGLVDKLLAAQLLELVPRRRASVESVLAAVFANFGGAPRLVMDELVSHDGVVELYCEDDELERVIEQTRRELEVRRG